jgi:hypothetical protein
MEYKGFQKTMAFFGALLILISTALVLVSTKSPEEVVGQLLFFLILLGALLYGKRGGIITGILASVIYASLHFTSIISMGVAPVLPLIIVRAAIYMVAGPLGGEIFFRIKHFMIEAGQSDFVDNDTKLFNAAYFGSLIDMESKKFERYNTISSVVTFAIDKETLKLYLDEPKTPGIKYIADGVVGNVRLVDEVGRINTETFAVILPFTPREGAEVVSKRLRDVMIGRVGYEDCVTAEIISLPADKERLDGLAAELAPAE